MPIANGNKDFGNTRLALVSVRGIVKRFGDLLANDVDSFEVRTSEVHVLLGENGAGKSTLVKCIMGVYKSDSGVVRVGGARLGELPPRALDALAQPAAGQGTDDAEDALPVVADRLLAGDQLVVSACRR